MRKILPGGTSRSYGIQVAKLAGIPDSVIARAREILSNLEKEEIDPAGRPRIAKRKGKRNRTQDEPHQTEMFGYPADDLLKELEDTDPNCLTPLQALTILAEWKSKYVGNA